MNGTSVSGGLLESVEAALAAGTRGGGGNVPRLLPLISELKIVTKRGVLKRLGEVLKSDQLDFINRCQHQLDTRGQIRMVVLKARQIGISTIIEAIGFVLAIYRQFFWAMVVSHERESSEHLLSMTTRYWDTFVFKSLYTTTYKGRSHLAWEHGSQIHVATARNIDAGRSTTKHFLHGSEVASWDHAEELMDGLLNAVPDFGLTAVFFESTAKGVGNFFHKECNKAMRGDSDYEFCFYPWFNDPEYTLDSIPKDLQEKYSVLDTYDEEELFLKERFGVSDEKLSWRRWCIANKLRGDLHKFHQEYPSNPHEAFISTGQNVFHLPNILKHYLPRGKKGQKRGNLAYVGGKIQFLESPEGFLTVYAYPSADKDWGVYLCGADPTHTIEGDFACIQVINRRTLEQVAVYRRKCDPITFGKDLQIIGTWYNTALLAIEKEGPGSATVGCVVADNYPNVYTMVRVDKMQGKPDNGLAGWSTNSSTKHTAIQRVVYLLSQDLVKTLSPDGGFDYLGLQLHDPITVMELRDYITTGKGLGYGNSDGSEYDDGVMALAIAAEVDAREAPPPAYEEVPTLDRAPSVRTQQSLPTRTGITSGHENLSIPPRDEPVHNESIEDELPDPPWEAWGVPRESDW